MEDSFRVRVDRAFGSLDSLSSSSPSAPSSLTSLWSLTGDAVDKREWNRSKGLPEPEPEPELEPFRYRRSPSGFKDDLEKDLEDIDDDEDDTARSFGGLSKPDDYDDEQWEIKSCIGRDCTLDYEEEEDQYDKQAIGKEKSGDRLYMKDISEDGIDIDSCNVLPASITDFVRDPRANHFAAKIRLKEDDEAAKKIDALHVSEKSVPDTGGDARGNHPSEDGFNPKSILKSKVNPLEPKSRKRVRFDPECDDRGNDESEGTRDVRTKTSSMEEDAASNQSSKSQEFASAVPDYIRNPSRYTRYTFDSSSDMDDKSNKQAYLDFLSQIKKSNAVAESQVDDLPSVTFIPKKKFGDAIMVDNEVVAKQKLEVAKEFVHRKALPVSIAAGEAENSDHCAMEEDEPRVIEDIRKSSQRLNRQYRKKVQEFEEPIV